MICSLGIIYKTTLFMNQGSVETVWEHFAWSTVDKLMGVCNQQTTR